MNTDDFEKQLQRQSPRQIPAGWREEILRTAQAGAHAVDRRQSPLLFRAGLTLWRELIWPCRHAWSGMAALWLVLLAVNARVTDAPKVPMTTATGTPAGGIQLFEEQRRVLVELTGPLELPPAEPSQRSRPRPRPRSERILALRVC